MKNLIILIGIFLIVTTGCKKDPIKSLPECVQDEISDFKKNKLCPSDSKVLEYSFQNQKVYVFEQGSCGADLSSTVIDEDCNILGYLGGFPGNNIINGDSIDSAQLEHTIWKD